MKYTGLNKQIWNNNFKSVVLLILFPVVIFGLTWLFIFLVQPDPGSRIDYTNQWFLRVLPMVAAGVLLWFIIAWFSHTKMIAMATGAAPLTRKENMRIYNLVENCALAAGCRCLK